MTSIHSKQITLLVGIESTYGTEVQATDDLGLIQSFSPTDKRTHTKIFTTGSRETQEIVAGFVDLDFEISLFLQHGRPLQYLLGTLAHAQTSSDWKHSITAVPTSIPSFSMEYSSNATSDYVFQYAGCKISQGTISLEKEGILTCSLTGKAKTVDTSDTAAETAVVSALPVLHYKQSTLSAGAAGSETSVGAIQGFNLNFNNTPVIANTNTSVLLQDIQESNFEITYDFTMLFENLTEYQRFLGTTSSTSPQTSPTPFSTIFNVHNGINLGSGRREFYAQLSNCQYEEVGTPVNVGEIIVASFKGNAETYGSNGVFFVDNISSTNFD